MENIISVLPGEKIIFILNLDQLLQRMHFVLEVCSDFPVSAFLGRAVIVNHREGDSCCVYIYLLVSHRGNNERSVLLIIISK